MILTILKGWNELEEGIPCRETLTGLRGGSVRTSWGLTRLNARSYIWSHAIPNPGWVMNG